MFNFGAVLIRGYILANLLARMDGNMQDTCVRRLAILNGLKLLLLLQIFVA